MPDARRPRRTPDRKARGRRPRRICFRAPLRCRANPLGRSCRLDRAVVAGAGTDSVFVQHLADAQGELRQLGTNHLPDDVHIDTEVLVNQDVAQSRSPLPFDVRVPGPLLLWQLLHRLADDFEIADDSVASLAVCSQLVP